MKNIDTLLTEIKKIIAQEKETTMDVLASRLVDLILNPYNGYEELCENNPLITEIGNRASDLEIRNGTEDELRADWQRIKEIVDAMENNIDISPNEDTIASKFQKQ